MLKPLQAGQLNTASTFESASQRHAKGAGLGKWQLPCTVFYSAFLAASAYAQSSQLQAIQQPSTAALETVVSRKPKADFGKETHSAESRKLADWVVHSADNGKLPFVIIDKVQARVFVFDSQGQLLGASSALLGLAIGDHSVPGIGQRKLSSIKPEERTTPAGRFVSSLGVDLQGHELLWVDYDTAVSLHPVVAGAAKERRAERLASASPLEKRISYGCINVPRLFYEKVVSPTFKRTEGVVYVMPETQTVHELFGSYDVPDFLAKQAASGQISTSDSTSK